MTTLLQDLNVRWTADLSVGSLLLDEHNRRMFSRLAEADGVLDAAVGGQEADLAGWLAATLDRLEVLLQEEERELAAAGYPELPFHRQLHGRARAKMQAARAHLDKRPGPLALDTLVRETCAELAIWLMRHVQDADKLFSPYVDARFRNAGP